MAGEIELPTRGIREEEAATTEEISAAIEALTDAELRRLERYARFRMRGLGERASGRDHEDLLREAMAVTLSGQRRWRRPVAPVSMTPEGTKSVTFFAHLLGVMRSLSSHWAEKGGSASVRSIPLEDAPEERSHEPDPERVTAARELLRTIEDRFADDPVVPILLRGFRDGLSGPEIQKAEGLSRKKYEAALKRLRRAAVRIDVESEETVGRGSGLISTRERGAEL